MTRALTIRKARLADAQAISDLVNHFAAQGLLLSRDPEDVSQHIRDFFVAESDRIVACCALRTGWADLAEVRSLAVSESHRGQGIASALVKEALREARELGYQRVFALTYVPDFFARLGFVRVDKTTLPQKIWTDCVKCPKFPQCDEVAVAITLGPGEGRAERPRGGERERLA